MNYASGSNDCTVKLWEKMSFKHLPLIVRNTLRGSSSVVGNKNTSGNQAGEKTGNSAASTVVTITIGGDAKKDVELSTKAYFLETVMF